MLTQIRRPARGTAVLGPEGSTGAFRPFGFVSPRNLIGQDKTPADDRGFVLLVVPRGVEPLIPA